MPSLSASLRAWTMRSLFRGLRWYTTRVPFARGRGLFIRPIEALKRRGWSAPLTPIGLGLVMEFEPSLLGWTTFQRGEWEPEQTAIVLQLLHPGAVVLDIGANTGYFALLAAARVGKAGRVHAFEIQPPILAILRRNIAHNDLRDVVTVVDAGCFSTEGEATIDPKGDPGAATVSFEDGGPRVRLTTVDRYAADRALARVDFVLVDAEGADLEVLKGASAVLDRFRPIVMAEAQHLASFGGSEAEMCTFMAQRGYTARPLNGEFARDLLFLPPGRELPGARAAGPAVEQPVLET